MLRARCSAVVPSVSCHSFLVLLPKRNGPRGGTRPEAGAARAAAGGPIGASSDGANSGAHAGALAGANRRGPKRKRAIACNRSELSQLLQRLCQCWPSLQATAMCSASLFVMCSLLVHSRVHVVLGGRFAEHSTRGCSRGVAISSVERRVKQGVSFLCPDSLLISTMYILGAVESHLVRRCYSAYSIPIIVLRNSRVEKDLIVLPCQTRNIFILELISFHCSLCNNPNDRRLFCFLLRACVSMRLHRLLFPAACAPRCGDAACVVRCIGPWRGPPAPEFPS